jgi:hypothetical protein
VHDHQVVAILSRSANTRYSAAAHANAVFSLVPDSRMWHSFLVALSSGTAWFVSAIVPADFFAAVFLAGTALLGNFSLWRRKNRVKR